MKTRTKQVIPLFILQQNCNYILKYNKKGKKYVKSVKYKELS